MLTTLLIAPVAVFDRAEAACDATPPVNDTIITCTGATNNPNGNGFGEVTDTGNTYNIKTGASVSGRFAGLLMDSGTVNNFGLVTGGRALRQSSPTATP